MMGKAVHDPEISEFGFGFTVTNGLTHFRSGTLSPWPTRLAIWWARWWRDSPHPPWDERCIQFVLRREVGLTKAEADAVVDAYGAPFIPTQHLENKFPVDVALASNGIFYFLQFKRSRCVSSKRGNITEVTEGKFDDFKLPFYRVYFYGSHAKSGKGDKKQRENLEALEKSLSHIGSALVRYAVPAFHTLAELSDVHQNGLAAHIEGRSPVMSIKASAFSLPGTGNHHISYDATGTGWRFSDEPEKVKAIQPLLFEIGNLASKAEPLGKTMKKLCKTLDKHAKEINLPQRPEKMDDKALLGLFGLRASRTEDEKATGEDTRGMAFLQAPVESEKRTAELANGIRKLLEYPIYEEETYQDDTTSRMAFLEDFFGADYRCQQILGQPLLVGVGNMELR